MTKLLRIVRRVDLLLVALTLLLSVVVYQRFAPPNEGIQADSAEEPSSPITRSNGRGKGEDAHSTKNAPIGSPVRFLMLNTQNYFVEEDEPRTLGNRRFKSVENREAVADTIASVRPDIVGLVEMGGQGALEDLSRRLMNRGLNYPYSRVLERWGEDRALAILSSHPIAGDDSVANCLLEEDSGECMRRGILDVTVRVEKDGRLFRIMGVHLKSRVGDDQQATERLRCREARALANHLQVAMQKDPGMPILVYGDWNAGPREAPLLVISQGTRATGPMRRIILKDSRGESWTISYRGNDEYNAFDQIYVNRVLSSRIGRKNSAGIVDHEASRQASDHRALWCDIR